MALLEVSGVGKRFGGLQALRDVSMAVNRGEIVGLIGPNGAGKTTLFNCISGLLSPTEGRVVFGGTDITAWPVHERARAGIARTFQLVQILSAMTVRDNLAVAAHTRTGGNVVGDVLRLGSSRRAIREARERARVMASFIGIEHLLDTTAGDLPFGMQRQVELARALCLRPELLLLDEAASGMDSKETGEFAEIVMRTRDAFRMSILWIEHDVPLIRDVCDYTYVLDFGEMLAEGTANEVMLDPRVREAYTGTPVEDAASNGHHESPSSEHQQKKSPSRSAPKKRMSEAKKRVRT